LIELLKSILTPLVFILLLLFLGLLITRDMPKKGGSGKTKWRLIFFGTLILFLLSLKPVSNLLVYTLECNYQPPSKEILSNLDAMIILTGGVQYGSVSAGGVDPSGATYSRLFNGVRIFKENNAKLLVLQGTSVVGVESDAAVMAGLAEQLGVPRDRMIIESGSRNTFEHAAALRKIFPAPKKLRLGIVTSAIHMRRSEMVFRWKFPKDVIVPIPVNYSYSTSKYDIKSFVPSWEAFAASNSALHELIGIVWYLLKHGAESRE
jgi:uncharacterized SAM-binding protein YcdF (DUF218 family)